MNGEELGHFHKLAFKEGVLDLNFTSVQMKKNRPGHKVSILLKKEDFPKITDLIFRHTTTLGFRYHGVKRKVMDRELLLKKTALGTFREKIASYKDIEKAKLDYDDLEKKID